MKKMFFYIENVQTWVNLKSVEAIYRNGTNWVVRSTSGMEIPLTDKEYWDITDAIRMPFEPAVKPQEKKDEA